MTESHVVLEWGSTWEPVHPTSALQEQLERELSAEHPLASMAPGVFGKCLTCDDVVTALVHAAGEPELAVIHLTWVSKTQRPRNHGSAWPFFERLTTPQFVERFLRGGEHL